MVGANRRREVVVAGVVRVMDWWHKLTLPVRQAWTAVSARFRTRKRGAGLLKLHDDIQTCGYQDVQVMWEMLCRTETELPQDPRQRRSLFWRIFMWSNRSISSIKRSH